MTLKTSLAIYATWFSFSLSFSPASSSQMLNMSCRGQFVQGKNGHREEYWSLRSFSISNKKCLYQALNISHPTSWKLNNPAPNWANFWRSCTTAKLFLFFFLRKLLSLAFIAVEWVFAVVQSLSHVCLRPRGLHAAHQASLSFTISQSLLWCMPTESLMPSNHFIFSFCFQSVPALGCNTIVQMAA